MLPKIKAAAPSVNVESKRFAHGLFILADIPGNTNSMSSP